jgi:hypothetical protein
MAIRRQQNWLGQERVDVADLRAIESGVAADVDVLVGKMLTGRVPLVLRGFTVSTTGTAGNPADQLQLSVAAGLLMHFGASESGTIFVADDNAAAQTLNGTNANVQGSFTASATNYVGLDLRRTADTSTSDLKKFVDATTVKEVSKTVPTARTLGYKIVISTQPFSVNSNICPIAKVVTDASNNVTSVTDARKLMFRLGGGGDTPNANASFTWANRAENAITYNPGASVTTDPFVGGDKNLVSLKQWMDAVMSRLWELGSGQRWYSATSRDGVKLLFGQPTVGATNDNFSWNSGTSTLTWDGLSVAFENSTVFYNTIQSGSTVINDGQCLYVELDRTTVTTIVPAVGDLINFGSPATPGNRFIIAWRKGTEVHVRDRSYEVGRTFPVATNSVLGVVKIYGTPADAANPVVLALDATGTLTFTAPNNLQAFNLTASNANGLYAVTTGSNSVAVAGTNQTGWGVSGTGKKGVIGFAWDSTSYGVVGLGPGAATPADGSGTGQGGRFIGGTSGTGAYGIDATGGAGYAAIKATAGSGNTSAITATGSGSGAAIVGTNTNVAYGVQGTGGLAGVNAVGASGSNGNGLKATGDGTGSGVDATGGATNGIGVKGTGVGTGAGVSASSPSGAAIKSTGGNVEIPNTNNYTYASAVTYITHVGPGDMKTDTPAAFALVGGARENTFNQISAATVPAKITFRFALPKGATITTLEINDEVTNAGSTFSSTVYVTSKVSSATAYTNTALESGGSGVSYNHSAGVTTRAWRTLAGVSGTMSDDGFIVVVIDMTAAAAASSWIIYGCRMTYTMTTVKPVG